MGIKVKGFVGESEMNDQERNSILAVIPLKGKFLEIGTFEGVSVGYWAKKRQDVQFISLDIFVKGSVGKWYKNKSNNQNLFIGTANEFLQVTRGHSFDIVFVDGDHSYEGCFNDLICANVFTKHYILAHDYGRKSPDGRHDGVKEAVDKFCKDFEWGILDKFCTTVLLRRKK